MSWLVRLLPYSSVKVADLDWLYVFGFNFLMLPLVVQKLPWWGNKPGDLSDGEGCPIHTMRKWLTSIFITQFMIHSKRAASGIADDISDVQYPRYCFDWLQPQCCDGSRLGGMALVRQKLRLLPVSNYPQVLTVGQARTKHFRELVLG